MFFLVGGIVQAPLVAILLEATFYYSLVEVSPLGKGFRVRTSGWGSSLSERFTLKGQENFSAAKKP